MHFRQAAETSAGIHRLWSMNCVSGITNYVRAIKQFRILSILSASAFYPSSPSVRVSVRPNPRFIPTQFIVDMGR